MTGMNREMRRKANVSGAFRPNPYDAAVAEELIELTDIKKQPHRCLPVFEKYHKGLTDYGFWYLLSTIWVSYSGFSDLDLWIKHFSSDRPDRERCIMKPDELKFYKKLPPVVTAYRAHRPGETKWIAYTLSLDKAKMFAETRNSTEIAVWQIPREKIIAYFSRRGEQEIIVPDSTDCVKVDTIPVCSTRVTSE